MPKPWPPCKKLSPSVGIVFDARMLPSGRFVSWSKKIPMHLDNVAGVPIVGILLSL